MLARVVLLSVLAVALAGRGALADGTCATAPDVVCPALTVLDPTANGADAQACCINAIKCRNDKFAGGDYCPYGYAPATVAFADMPAKLTSDTPTVELCCVRDATIASFPVCNATNSGGATALQAPTADDSSWLVQDGNGFTRSVGRYTGMCFNIRIDTSDCTGFDTKCCTTKPPAYLQFKVPTSPDTKCKVSYGTSVANIASLKRMTSWLATQEINGAGKAKYFNVPITWKKGAKTGTACVYSLTAADKTLCPLELICGLGDGVTAARVPDATTGSYDQGCELRVVGRKSATSSACCATTFSVTSFDPNEEFRAAAADGAPVLAHKIALKGV